MDRLAIDIAKCISDTDDGNSLTPNMLDRLAPRLDRARLAVLGNAGSGMLGWMDLPGQDPAPYLDFAAQNRGRYDSLLVIGIGGSALGTTALATALLPFYYNELDPAGAEHGLGCMCWTTSTPTRPPPSFDV